MSERKHRFTHITEIHLLRLVYRSFLFLAVGVFYVLGRLQVVPALVVLVCKWLVWGVFMGEMLLRFFPSPYESMGCQKQFKQNYRPTGVDKSVIRLEKRQLDRSALLCLGCWLLLNGIIAALYLTGCIGQYVMLLLSLAYSVCDMICILFFCPFQSWIMKNRCCGTCRIYNWDYAMMFTPLLFVKGFFAATLVIAALALLVRWEVTFYLRPERFLSTGNACLDCSACQEKLCRHKKSIQKFLQAQKRRLFG